MGDSARSRTLLFLLEYTYDDASREHTATIKLENLKQRNKEFTSFFSEFLGLVGELELERTGQSGRFTTRNLGQNSRRTCWQGSAKGGGWVCHNVPTNRRRPAFNRTTRTLKPRSTTTIHDHDHDHDWNHARPINPRPRPPLGPRPPRTLETNPHNHDMSTTLWTSTLRVFGRTLRPDRTSEEIDLPRVRASDADNELTFNETALFVSSRGYERIARRGLCCHDL